MVRQHKANRIRASPAECVTVLRATYISGEGVARHAGGNHRDGGALNCSIAALQP
ncbi:MAG TPA: hypothetical protein VF600_13605 [Abditibacteriaceae bacterium]